MRSQAKGVQSKLESNNNITFDGPFDGPSGMWGRVKQHSPLKIRSLVDFWLCNRKKLLRQVIWFILHNLQI